MLGKFIAGDFIAIAGEMRRFPASNENNLLKIDISSNGQNCSILSHNVLKFELYKYNDELFNIYYGIIYEL